jgi:hypothetical protein
MLIAQSFFIATVISHFHCYSAQPFLMQKELSHFSMVQYLVIFSLLQYSAVFHCYSTHSFLVTTVREADQSFCKMTELGRGRSWVGGGARLDRGRLMARSRVRWTEQRVARVGCALARSVGPLVGSR